MEVACNEPVGEDIRKCLTEELGKLDSVIVVDEGPDWVFSIIALHHGLLVELSVILRRFFLEQVSLGQRKRQALQMERKR